MRELIKLAKEVQSIANNNFIVNRAINLNDALIQYIISSVTFDKNNVLETLVGIDKITAGMAIACFPCMPYEKNGIFYATNADFDTAENILKDWLAEKNFQLKGGWPKTDFKSIADKLQED